MAELTGYLGVLFAMESVKFNIVKHGPVAAVQLLPDCVIGMTHSDGYEYAVAIPDICEHGELVAVKLIGASGQGMGLTFDDGHDQTILFADIRSERANEPLLVPAMISESRVRELAL